MSATAAGGFEDSEIRGFGLVSPDEGWVLIGQHIYWTKDSGKSWTDITPALNGWEIGAVDFLDTQHGWAVLAASGGAAPTGYELARTADGGVTWQTGTLQIFGPGEAAYPLGAVYLQFVSGRTGWLVLRRVSSANFDLGVLFKTTDGGDHWTQLQIPIGDPVHFADEESGWVAGGAGGNEFYRTQDGGRTWVNAGPGGPPAPSQQSNTAGMASRIVELDMITSQLGWGKYTDGSCTPAQPGANSPVHCTSETGLAGTQDGGRTWQDLSLPQLSLVADIPAVSSQAQGFTGQGFDVCEAPSLSILNSWMASSPYRVVNLYIGGSSRACPNSGLNASYVASASGQGWKFIPTWVGPQAPFSGFLSSISSDQTSAYNQGITEANAASDAAAALGLPSGTPIYYDLEPYTTTNTVARNAVDSFISGWSYEVRARGNLAGVYGSTCGSAMSDYAGIPNVPDGVWLGSWIDSSYDPGATVWGVSCVSDSLWSNHQRLRQYAGDHPETWGGVTLSSIDSDVIDGMVAGVAPTPTPTPTSTPNPRLTVKTYLPLIPSGSVGW